MDAFVKQIPVSETIFGNIKKPPDIICGSFVFLDSIQLIMLMSEIVFHDFEHQTDPRVV